jgi:hypothetical protein
MAEPGFFTPIAYEGRSTLYRARGVIVENENSSQYFSENPDPQEKTVSMDDITPSQEQHDLRDRLP